MHITSDIIKRALSAVCVTVFLISHAAQAQQNTLRLWYTSPAKQWEACLPLGNGRLGAMPDGGVNHENIVLNDITLWSGGKQDADDPKAYTHLPEIRQLLLAGKNIEAQQIMSKYFKCAGRGSGEGNGANVPYGSYQVLGTMCIKYNYAADSAYRPANYRRTLILDSALARTTYTLNGTSFKREYITSFNDDVIAIKLSANQAKKINFTVSLNRPERFETSFTAKFLEMHGSLDNGTNGNGMRYDVRLAVKAYGGNILYGSNTVTLNNADSAVIYVSACTNFIKKNIIAANLSVLKSAMAKTYSRQLTLHTNKFQKLFKRVNLDLKGNGKENLPTDQRLIDFQHGMEDNQLPALYFQFGRYLAISSTRVGLLPPNLQGLWANTIQTPWNGDYHLDINIQMNEWPLEPTNLGMLNEPYFKLVSSLVKPGEKTAKAYYNANGWVAHVITNIWGYTSPGEDYSWGAYNTGSAWLCQMLWTHYQFSHDNNYLKKLYPVLKGSATFYLDMLVCDPKNGWLVTAPSNSPENAFITKDGQVANVCVGPTIDNQLLRFLFNATIQAGDILKTSRSFNKRLLSAVKQLPPDQIGKDGRLMEWLEEYKEPEPHHRHTSHLWGLYPGNEINIGDTVLANAAKASLLTRGDEGTGWSLAWKMNFWARLHDGDHALLLFRKLLRPVVESGVNMKNGGGSYSNLFCAHPPFQIDGNFGGTAAIAEMLLQSQDGFIELLPALPIQWKTGSFSGLRARNGLKVSASWDNHILSRVSLKSDLKQSLKVKLPLKSNVSLVYINGKSVPFKIKDGFLITQVNKNDKVTLKFE